MRFIEEQKFRPEYAEALIEKHHLEIPDGCEEGLDYVQQFVDYRGIHSADMSRCYIPDNYVDDLVSIRDASSSRRFSGAVGMLCVDGNFSQKYNGNLSCVTFSYENQIDLENRVREIRSEASSRSVRSDIISLNDVIRNTRSGDSLEVYLPSETADVLREEAPQIFTVEK